jgi:hypothetical protein
MRRARHIARVEGRETHAVVIGKPKRNYHLVELSVDDRIIAELVLSKQDGECGCDPLESS